MNDQLKRTAALLLLLASLWGGYLAWQTWRGKQALTALAEVARSADLDKLLVGDDAELREAIDLAARDISLTQGSDGMENWRLKAAWAALNQESGLLTVRDPVVRYRLGEDDGRFVHGSSRVARVENNNTFLSVEGEVRVVHEQDVLTGPRATFDSVKRILTFPSGADLASPQLNGHATTLVWDLSANVLSAHNRVNMIWTPPPPAQPERAPAIPLASGMPEQSVDAAPPGPPASGELAAPAGDVSLPASAPAGGVEPSVITPSGTLSKDAGEPISTFADDSHPSASVPADAHGGDVGLPGSAPSPATPSGPESGAAPPSSPAAPAKIVPEQTPTPAASSENAGASSAFPDRKDNVNHSPAHVPEKNNSQPHAERGHEPMETTP